jgi:hypothetical protein
MITTGTQARPDFTKDHKNMNKTNKDNSIKSGHKGIGLNMQKNHTATQQTSYSKNGDQI